MAGIQGGEFIVILLVALIVFGPSRLPDLARRAGRWTAELRQAARELRVGIEAEVGDLREIRQELEAPVNEVRDELRQANRELDETAGEARRLKWVGPKPVSGPTPEEALADLDEIEGGEAQEKQA